MSKSVGNVISPFELINRYGTDATRYFLLRHVNFFDDTDITWERLDEWYTANLVNGLGNLVARIMKMAETHLSEPVSLSTAVVRESDNYRNKLYKEAYESFDLNKVADLIWEYIGETDEIIQEKQPFKLVKEDKKAAEEIIRELVRRLETIAVYLAPMLPETAEKIKEAIKENKKPANFFERKERYI